MPAERARVCLEATAASGPAARVDALASVAVDLDVLAWHAGLEGVFAPGSLVVRDAATGSDVPAQYRPGELSWLLPGETPAGARRHFEVSFDARPPDGTDPAPGKANLRDRVLVTDLGSELLVSRNERELGRYRYRGVWKPYFYPLNGPDGAVVRERGEEPEHPFHHGLWVSYGSMEGHGVNIWTESGEIRPRRGPTGRIVHRGFDRLQYGWVYAEVVERLEYQKPDGWPFAGETRTIRISAPTEGAFLIDCRIRLEEPDDDGPRPTVFAARVASTMRVRDLALREPGAPAGDPPGAPRERPGRIENARGEVNEAGCRGRPTPWVDYSGPVGEGWNGLALFDHPSNPGFPTVPGAREYGLMSFSRPYPGGSAAEYRYGAYVHGGDAGDGRVGAAWTDFAYPCRVSLGEARP